MQAAMLRPVLTRHRHVMVLYKKMAGAWGVSRQMRRAGVYRIRWAARQVVVLPAAMREDPSHAPVQARFSGGTQRRRKVRRAASEGDVVLQQVERGVQTAAVPSQVRLSTGNVEMPARGMSIVCSCVISLREAPAPVHAIRLQWNSNVNSNRHGRE